MDKGMKQHLHEFTNEGKMDRKTHAIHACVRQSMHGEMNGGMDRPMDGWMDGWMEPRRPHEFLIRDCTN